MHYYQFNIADYRKDTAHLKPIEHYIYRTLIDWCYLDESPIPKETQTVLRRLGLGTEDEPNVRNVLSDFFYLTDSGWVHKRIEQEIIEYHTKCKTNSTNGKKGGRPKKTRSVNFANPIESEKKPNQEPLTNNHKPEDITHTVYPSQQSREPTPAASVCLELKKIGIIDLNPTHPKLLMLIETGATIDEFMNAARTAKDKGKGFAYVLGIVKGQRADAAQLGEKPGKRSRSPPASGGSRQQLMMEAGRSLFAHRDEEKGHEREIEGTAEFVECDTDKPVAGVVD